MEALRSGLAAAAAKASDALNEPQRRAVHAPADGATVVLAGPGSGKTRVIAARVVHLLTRLPPSASTGSITCVSFTNKAAKEMQERLHATVAPAGEQRGRALRPVLACTFHSLCFRLLKRHASKLGLSPGFKVADTSESTSIAKEALKTLPHAHAVVVEAERIKERDLLNAISRWKNGMVDAAMAQASARSSKQRALALAYETYEAKMASEGKVDFDGLLLLVAEALVAPAGSIASEAGRSMAEACRHLLVDEWQDTNSLQLRIVLGLSSVHGSVFVVCVAAAQYAM